MQLLLPRLAVCGRLHHSCAQRCKLAYGQHAGAQASTKRRAACSPPASLSHANARIHAGTRPCLPAGAWAHVCPTPCHACTNGPQAHRRPRARSGAQHRGLFVGRQQQPPDSCIETHAAAVGSSVSQWQQRRHGAHACIACMRMHKALVQLWVYLSSSAQVSACRDHSRVSLAVCPLALQLRRPLSRW
jgi:hypothetical protein